MIDSLIVLGGGTSGLITALVTRAFFPALKIQVVKSSSLGIIGVGEGSTEHWRQFMSTINVSVGELLANTGATLKTGIKFDNWNGDNISYRHAIYDDRTGYGLNRLLGVYMHLVGENAPQEQLTAPYGIQSQHLEPLEDSVNQFHFDTVKLNEFLLRLCLTRGIEIADAEIKDVVINDAGCVTSLVSEDGHNFAADFFIDSSGFNRIISSKLGVNWKSCQEYLPMNSAIAFPTTGTDDIPSHTTSRALSAGWMWQIPTQDRYGNGYVYCDKFISDADAVAEAQRYHTDKIKIAKSFKFDAGYVDKFWIKNCVSVGLSGSFIEPLEASSIGTSIQQAFSFAEKIITWTTDNQYVSEIYNTEFTNVLSNIVDFVQLHYITKRTDTDFWKYCKTLKLTEFNQRTLDLFKISFPTRSFFNTPYIMFREPHWILVMHGLGLFDTDAVKKLKLQQDLYFCSSASEQINWLKNTDLSSKLFSHRDAIDIILARHRKSQNK